MFTPGSPEVPAFGISVTLTPRTSVTRVVVDTVWAVVLSSGVAVTLTYWPTGSESAPAGGCTVSVTCRVADGPTVRLAADSWLVQPIGLDTIEKLKEIDAELFRFVMLSV